MSYTSDDLEAVAGTVVAEFRHFAGRQDYVHLAVSLLADRRYPIDVAVVSDLIDYADEHAQRLVSAQARRLRGVRVGSRADLEAALEAFEQMGARPLAARVRTELGIAVGDQALIDRGLDELTALGDVEQAARVAAESREAAARK